MQGLGADMHFYFIKLLETPRIIAYKDNLERSLSCKTCLQRNCSYPGIQII